MKDIIEALSIYLKSTVFSFKSVLYHQIFGVFMGSSISPILADIFMEFLEHRVISTFHTAPKLWVTYVDGTFCVIEQQYAEEFHKHLNSISPSITFTLEHEQNQSMAFLDVKVTRNRDNLFPQPSTKSPLTLTDISNLTRTIPNTTNLLWPKLYITESIHRSRAAMTKQHFTNKGNTH